MPADNQIKYSALVSPSRLQALMESFSNVTGTASGILDVDGTVVASAGWQDACRCFHRINADSRRLCLDSDTTLVAKLTQGAAFAIYRCPNGLVDTAAPIILQGRHVANVFTGQFLTESPDLEFFRRRARLLGFDEAAYLEAIARVPVLSQERIESLIRLYAQLAAMLADNGLDRIEQMNAVQALAEMNSHLEETVQERTRELEQANSVLRYRERSLQESHKALHSILKASLDGYWRVDQQGNLLDVNPAYCQLSGYTRDELLGMNIADLEAVESAYDIARRIQMIVEASHAQFESLHRRKDGSTWPVEVSASYSDSDSGTDELFVFLRNISTRRLAEEALKASEQRFRDLVDTTNGVVWEADAQTFNFTFISQKAESLLGYPVDDWLVPGFWVKHLHPDDLAWAPDYCASCTRVLQPHDFEYRFIARNGSTIWLRDIVTVVAEAGEARWLRGIMVDITEQKRSEQELLEARSAAERADQSKSHFLAAASHDLRQPLAALSLFVEALKKRLAPDHGELVANIQECVGSLSELLTDLLDVSKLDAGVVNPHLKSFAIDDLLTTLLSVYSAEASVKGLSLRVRCSAGVTCSDRRLLQRILGNFVANAIRYTPSGGVLISCRRHEGRDWIEVWDTGIGIPADKTDVVFEEFRRLGDESRTRGSGLGLAIARKTAQLLGLQIRLRSRPGRGSMFAVELPPGQVILPAESPVSPTRTKVFRIGLVDDHQMMLDALAVSLESAGHQVVAATSGKVLLDRLGGQKPDLVISDYRLADNENGFQVIAAAKKKYGSDLPAILITGDTSPELVRAMADRGIPVLYKPLQIDMLQTLISEQTQRR